MITAAEAAELQRVIRNTIYGPRNHGPAGDVLDLLYSVVCYLTDPDDRYTAAEGLVDAAMRLRDECDDAIVNATEYRAAARADDRIKEII